MTDHPEMREHIERLRAELAVMKQHEPEARAYDGDVRIVCLNPRCDWSDDDGPFWEHWERPSVSSAYEPLVNALRAILDKSDDSYARYRARAALHSTGLLRGPA